MGHFYFKFSNICLCSGSNDTTMVESLTRLSFL